MRIVLTIILYLCCTAAFGQGRPIVKGATDQTTYIRIIDSTDKTPETGVVAATAGLDLEYVRTGAAAVDLTESDLASASAAHSDGGIFHVGHGLYRVDLPDAAVATGVNEVHVQGTATGMIVEPVRHALTLPDFMLSPVNWGDYPDDNQIINLQFSTPGLLTSGTAVIYEDGSTTEITTAETLTTNFDSLNSQNNIAVDLADAGFETGKTYAVFLSAGTVPEGGVRGQLVGTFSVERMASAEDVETAMTDRLPEAAAILNMNTVFNADFASNYNATADRWKADLTHFSGSLMPISPVGGQLPVDVTHWNNETVPVLQIQEAFDNDGTGGDMDLTSLVIHNTSGIALLVLSDNGTGALFEGNGASGTGVVMKGSGTGPGLDLLTDDTGVGLQIAGGSTSGVGVSITSTNTHALSLDGGASGDDLSLAGDDAPDLAGVIWNALRASYNVADSMGETINDIDGSGEFDDAMTAWYAVSQLETDVLSRLAPTVAGRTLDVSTTGESGIDLGNIGSPASVVNLSGVTIGTVTSTATVTGNVNGNVTGNVLGSTASVTGNIGGNVVGSVNSVIGNVGGNVTGSVGSVTGAVGSVTGNVGGNVVGSVASVTGNVGGSVASVTNLDTTAIANAVAAQASIAAGLTRVALALPASAPGSGSGLAIASQATDIQGRLPAALVGGKMDSTAEITLEPEDLDTLAEGLSTAIGDVVLTDTDLEPVPSQRTVSLIHTANEGLRYDRTISLRLTGQAVTLAVDFAADMPANGRIATVDSIAIVSGPSGGLTFVDDGRDYTKAKIRILPATAGTYIVRVRVTYTTNSTAEGRIRIIVP